MRSQDKFSLTVSCKLPAKTPNKAKDDNKVTGRTVKPVKRLRPKKNRSPSALARSRKRHARFLEKKLAGKPDLASPEEDQQDLDNSVCVKELENTRFACGSNRDLVLSENPTPSPAADLDLLNELAILREFLDTFDSDDSDDDSDNDVSSVYSVCSNCKHPAKKGEDLKRCSRCHITRYCSVQCQERLRLSPICLCCCGQEVGHCKSLILYHKDLYIFVKRSQVTIFYSSLDTFINTN